MMSKGEFHEFCLRDGTIGAFYERYPSEKTADDRHARDEARRAAREILKRNLESPSLGHSPEGNRSRGIDR